MHVLAAAESISGEISAGSVTAVFDPLLNEADATVDHRALIVRFGQPLIIQIDSQASLKIHKVSMRSQHIRKVHIPARGQEPLIEDKMYGAHVLTSASEWRSQAKSC